MRELVRQNAVRRIFSLCLMCVTCSIYAGAPNEGWELLRTGKYTEACDAFEGGGSDPLFLYELADCFFQGRGRPKSSQKAEALLRRAIELGAAFTLASERLAFSLLIGPEDEERYAEAIEITQEALQADDKSYGRNEFNIGLAYLSGRGLPQDDQLAAKWFSKSQKEGHFLGGIAVICMARSDLHEVSVFRRIRASLLHSWKRTPLWLRGDTFTYMPPVSTGLSVFDEMTGLNRCS
nr:sel1 repeat family protein [Oceanococcus sp. HetDA_MAG_MS8]